MDPSKISLETWLLGLIALGVQALITILIKKWFSDNSKHLDNLGDEIKEVAKTAAGQTTQIQVMLTKIGHLETERIVRLETRGEAQEKEVSMLRQRNHELAQTLQQVSLYVNPPERRRPPPAGGET